MKVLLHAIVIYFIQKQHFWRKSIVVTATRINLVPFTTRSVNPSIISSVSPPCAVFPFSLFLFLLRGEECVDVTLPLPAAGSVREL